MVGGGRLILRTAQNNKRNLVQNMELIDRINIPLLFFLIWHHHFTQVKIWGGGQIKEKIILWPLPLKYIFEGDPLPLLNINNFVVVSITNFFDKGDYPTFHPHGQIYVWNKLPTNFNIWTIVEYHRHLWLNLYIISRLTLLKLR